MAQESPVSQMRPIQCCTRFRTAVAIPYFQESCELANELRFVQGFCEMAAHAQNFEQMDEMLMSMAKFLEEHLQRRKVIEHFFFQTPLNSKEHDAAKVAGELARLRARVAGSGGALMG